MDYEILNFINIKLLKKILEKLWPAIIATIYNKKKANDI